MTGGLQLDENEFAEMMATRMADVTATLHAMGVPLVWLLAGHERYVEELKARVERNG